MIFPLPLVPFEEYMLFDDRPTHPMSFFLKLVFSGECKSGVLDAALQTALRRHPLLSARIEETKQDRFFWIHGQPEKIAVRWIPDDGQFSAPHLDLFSEPGLCVSARRQNEETELVLQLHHSCCDAMGALRFSEDLLVAYAAAVGSDDCGSNQPGDFRPIEERRLLGRGRFGLTPWKLLRMAHRQAKGLLGARHFLMRQPVPLQPVEMESVTAELPNGFPAACMHQFSETETVGLMTAARKARITVNDLLTRDLFLALGDFRSSRQLDEGSEWLRLSVPMNLRGPEDEQLSAANVVSMIFLDRQPQDFSDAQTLLEGINRQMQSIKKNQLGLTFPLSLRFTRSLPGAISRLRGMFEKPTCRGTAVLSNLGRPLQAAPLPRCDGKIVTGGMTLERMEFLPPVRPLMLAAFGVFTYADRLHVALHYDPRGLTIAEAEELLGGFIKQICKTGNNAHAVTIDGSASSQ